MFPIQRPVATLLMSLACLLVSAAVPARPLTKAQKNTSVRQLQVRARPQFEQMKKDGFRNPHLRVQFDGREVTAEIIAGAEEDDFLPRPQRVGHGRVTVKENGEVRTRLYRSGWR